MERLERRVDILEQLPDRVSALESPIVLLRDEMRGEFSATQARDEETRRLLTERIDSVSGVLTQHMDSLSGALTQRMDSMFDVLSARMVSLFDENERHMRLLHEDLIQRIANIREDRS